jgi:hypothetical protein
LEPAPAFLQTIVGTRGLELNPNDEVSPDRWLEHDYPAVAATMFRVRQPRHRLLAREP